jgi:hypothetical protein
MLNLAFSGWYTESRHGQNLRVKFSINHEKGYPGKLTQYQGKEYS